MTEHTFLTSERLRWFGLLPLPGGEPSDPRARLSLDIGAEAHAFEVEIAPALSATPGEPERWRLRLLPDGPGFDLARRPFHRSPGRWHLCCPGCGRWRAALALVPPTCAEPSLNGSADVAGTIWACRECLGLPPPAQRLSVSQRIFRAVERAEHSEHRQPGERLDRWRRRQAKAAMVMRRATTRLTN